MENIQYKKRFKKKEEKCKCPRDQESSPIYNGTNWINPPRESTESELDEATKLWVEGR